MMPLEVGLICWFAAVPEKLTSWFESLAEILILFHMHQKLATACAMGSYWQLVTMRVVSLESDAMFVKQS